MTLIDKIENSIKIKKKLILEEKKLIKQLIKFTDA